MNEAKIGVVGLGYVGLATSLSLAEAGFKIIGIDVDREKIKSLNEGICSSQSIFFLISTLLTACCISISFLYHFTVIVLSSSFRLPLRSAEAISLAPSTGVYFALKPRIFATLSKLTL